MEIEHDHQSLYSKSRRGYENEPLATCLNFQDVSISYNTPVIRHITFKVPKGKITAIIGPSGCGKSSLLMAINHLAQEQGAVVQGDILFEGSSILQPIHNSQSLVGYNLIGQLSNRFQRRPKIDLLRVRRDIGLIFQRPNPFPTTIYKNIEIPLKEHGYCKSERHYRIESVLQDVGLWSEVKNRLKQQAYSLSGGQQQRLCIARALALQPKVLLMDEPCSALDPIASGVVDDLISRLAGAFTVVVVTHNLEQARQISHQTAFIGLNGQCGELIEFGETKALFAQPKCQQTYDYTQSA